jgi:hypothetical protein
MIDIKQLTGYMNTDDANDSIASGQHKYSKNITWRGAEGNKRPEGVRGTTLIADNLPAGNSESIGRFYDEKKRRIFSFIYNSSGLHSIRQFTIGENGEGVIVSLVTVGSQTDGDILGFTLDGKIYAVKVLYGDDEQGDELWWNNSQKQPCKINIKKALAGTYGTIKRSYIDVIKAPAKMPPAVVYENDGTVTVNNLRKRLFLIRTRFRYLDKEKPVYSSMSAMPLPVNYLDTAIDKDPTKNCRIAIVIPTGEADVTDIEVAAVILPDASVKPGDEITGWFTIANLNKSALSISSNDLYTLRFYNNQVYLPCDPVDSVQLQDLVPLEANGLEFLNGNVPVYGGITEGFDKTTILGSSTSGSVSQRTTQLPYIFVASQSGDSGFGTGNIHAVVIGVPSVGDVFNIYTTAATITFTCTVATSANVITGLSAAAVVAGFTVVSSDTENLVITKTNESLQRVLAVPVAIAVTDSFVYDRNARFNFAIEYLDAAGRTIGSETNTTLPVQTINYTETTGTPNIPKISLSISNRPPLHARYFHIARSRNLSKLTKLEWVSDRTFKDDEYAYISIENLNRFIKENPSAKHLQYDFSAGDRIRFMKVLSGTTNTIYTTQDFEIQAQVLTPAISGVEQEGQFIKIVLPTTSGTFDFGSNDFQNYFIELYTPAKSVAEGLDKYFEFSERYTIGNPGTVTAFHQGMTQNQTSDLVTPALFEFTQGDFYYRPRTINTGGILDYIITAGERGAGRHTVGVTFVERDFTDANITTGNSPLQNLSGWTYASSSRAIIIMGGGATTTRFKAKGSIIINAVDDDTFYYFFQDNTGAITYANTIRGITAGLQTIPIDCTFELAAGQHISFLGWSESDYANSKVYTQTDLQITIQRPFTVNVIDPNFSDFFPSAVNSNGRPSIVDINAAQLFKSGLLRWGLSYIKDSSINETTRFREVNFDDIPTDNGDIVLLDVEGMELRIFQQMGTCRKGVYGKFIQDSGGQNILTTTDEILAKNNVDYYENRHGIGNQPLSFIKSRKASYFIDPIVGEQIRLSPAGLDSISVQNKGQYYIKSLLSKYNSEYLRTNGSIAKIIQHFDYFEDNCVTMMQGGVLNGETIENNNLSFNEKRNAYGTFGDLNYEMAISAGDYSYFWKNGQMYVQNDTVNYCKFFGTQFYPSITLVFNDKVQIKKTFDALAYQASGYWVAETNGDIVTSQPNEQTGLSQISQLKQLDFEINEGVYYAALLRDANSMADARVALQEGDFLKGVWIECKLTYKGTDFSYLYLPYIKYEPSPRNL